MLRKQVLLLYRTKLRLCKYMGYKFGSWKNDTIVPQKITSGMLRKHIKTNVIGNFIWNNIRIQYKVMIDERDPNIINDAIDNGFIVLRFINDVTNLYKSERKLLT